MYQELCDIDFKKNWKAPSIPLFINGKINEEEY